MVEVTYYALNGLKEIIIVSAEVLEQVLKVLREGGAEIIDLY